MPVMFGLNGWVQNIVLAWSGWLMLWMTGLIGTAAIGYDAVRNVRRYGYLATSRPRYYFELGRATLALAFLLVAPALTIAFLVPNINVLGINFVSLRRFLMFLAALFCLFAVCGYLCSFVTRRARCGRAYECVSWFFCVLGGIFLVTFGYLAIPDPPQGLGAAIPGIVTSNFGVILLGCGVCTEVIRIRRKELRDANRLSLRDSTR